MQNNCHMSVLIHEQAKKYGEKVALNYRDFGSLKWKTATWNDFSRVVKIVSNALLNLGVRVQENIGVFSQNTVPTVFDDARYPQFLQTDPFTQMTLEPVTE